MNWTAISAIVHQYKSGSLDEESWESCMAPVPAIFATERAKAVLRFYVGSPGFMQMLADRIAAAGTPAPPPRRPVPKVD